MVVRSGVVCAGILPVFILLSVQWSSSGTKTQKMGLLFLLSEMLELLGDDYFWLVGIGN